MWLIAHWLISENRTNGSHNDIRTRQMTDERVTSGRRIAELLASEVTARTNGPLSHLTLVDVHSEVDGSETGTFAYAITLDDDDDTTTRLAEVFVHPDRVRLEFHAGIDSVSAVGEKANLRVRPKAVEPPRVLVFIEDGGEIKRALDVISAAISATHGAS